MAFNQSLLQKHPVVSTYIQWRKNELDNETKEKALQVLQPYVNDVINQYTYSEKQKQQIDNLLKQQTKIYDTHKEIIEEIL